MQEMTYFYLLKEAILRKYREEFPHWDKPIHDFKGREIANFQQQLQATVQGRVSEKWFYTHIKPTENKKLPRVDMLDLLSEFVGYANWDDFKAQNKVEHPKVEKQVQETTAILQERKNPFTFNKTLIATMAGIALILMGLLALTNSTATDYHYQACFIDADQKTPIVDRPIDVIFLNKNESPISKQASKDGCVELDSEASEITFVVKAPYYLTDTITRIFKEQKQVETIALKVDDYSLMIHLFSTGNIKDWKRRREQLNKMFADDAIIFQMAADGRTGMEMYNREEFINKLTMPINSLKNIEILNTEKRGEEISKLRFVIRDKN